MDLSSNNIIIFSYCNLECVLGGGWDGEVVNHQYKERKQKIPKVSVAFAKVNTMRRPNPECRRLLKAMGYRLFSICLPFAQDSCYTSYQPRGWLRRTTSSRGSDQGLPWPLQLPNGFANGISGMRLENRRIGVGFLSHFSALFRIAYGGCISSKV